MNREAFKVAPIFGSERGLKPVDELSAGLGRVAPIFGSERGLKQQFHVSAELVHRSLRSSARSAD